MEGPILFLFQDRSEAKIMNDNEDMITITDESSDSSVDFYLSRTSTRPDYGERKKININVTTSMMDVTIPSLTPSQIAEIGQFFTRYAKQFEEMLAREAAEDQST